MKIAYKFPLVLGVIGMASVAALPAMAGNQAYANGSSTIVLMNGASQSIAAEIAAPGLQSFVGPVLVTPTLEVPGDGTLGGLDTNAQSFVSLGVDPGAVDTTVTAAASFTAAAADALINAPDLSSQVSIIRAGAGVDGLE